MERITISVSPSVKRRLEDVAHADRRSVNVMAGLLIERYFQSQEAVKAPKPAPMAPTLPAELPPVISRFDAPPPMSVVELGLMEAPVPMM